MDEPERDPGRDLVDDASSRQVGADPPVVLAADPVIDPTAPRRLQQGMAEDQHEPAARLEHPRHLVERGLELVDVLERQAHQHGVERAVRHGSASARPLVYSGPPARSRAARTCDEVGSSPTTSDADLGEAPGDLAFPAADVEDPAGAAEVVGDEGEDLVLVLRVGAGGELALPPAGVPLPERFVVPPVHPLPGSPVRPSLRQAATASL